MKSLYSIRDFCEISEVPNSSTVECSFALSNNLELNFFGLKCCDVSNYGIFSPFWDPQFLGLSNIDEIGLIIKKFIDINCSQGVRAIKIKLPPSFYANGIDLVKFHLIKGGFRIIDYSLWQTIDLVTYKTARSYESSLKHSSRKVIKRFSEYDDNPYLELIDNQSPLECVYDLIAHNRIRLGTSLKYSIGYLHKLINICPDRIRIFKFHVRGQFVAAAICHLTANDILYVAAWADSLHGLTHSPMYKFASKLVGYCIENEIRYLDFGISSSVDLFTPGLFKFKANLGCFTSVQETFIYERVLGS